MTSAHSTRNTSIRTRKIRGEESFVSSISIAEREAGPAGIAGVIRWVSVYRAPIWHSGAEKKDQIRLDSGVETEPVAETGLGLVRIFADTVLLPLISGILDDRFVPGGAGRDRLGALDPDGHRMGGATAHRQFRLGRYHLDLCGGTGRCRQRAVAGRGRCAESAAMAGRGPGGGLVAAAGGPHRRALKGDIGRSPLRRFRQRMGRGFAAPDVRLPAKSGVRIDPAGVCD